MVQNIVVCQRGGVSEELPWLQAATRHGPLTKKKKNNTGQLLDLFYYGRVSLAHHNMFY